MDSPPNAQIGLIGLAVMGQNLARNIARNGFRTSVYNRTTETTTKFIEEFGNDNLQGETDLRTFVLGIERPRRIILMVKAGAPVDAVIDQLLPLLEPDDLLIDAGNSNYLDTIRREKQLAPQGIHFLGTGVSGGEEGALHGPSIMPGGSELAWQMVQPVFEKIAARDFDGGPCVTHIGPDGAGHYVKMVHNGIEYGVMQLLAEVYDLLRTVYAQSPDQIAAHFATLNKGKLNSYLLEIATPVLSRQDDQGEGFLVDHILDQAGQKGTGRWTVIDAAERGVPLPTIAAAVDSRIISSRREERLSLAKGMLQLHSSLPFGQETLDQIEDALYAALLTSYAQGYDLITQAALAQHWQINLSELSRIWEGGCIIRAQLLKVLHEAYADSDKLSHLFAIPSLQDTLSQTLPSLRQIVNIAQQSGVPVPALSGSLGYIDSFHRAELPANLIQGLRDFFGAHTYQRLDRPGSFHTNWQEN